MKTAERLMKIDKQKDIVALRAEFYNAMFTLSKLIDLIHDKQIGFPRWMQHIEVLLIKLVQHTSSLNHLAEPLALLKRDNHLIVKAYDRASIYVIARAQMEAFLTFYYLILSPETHEQGEFYDLTYELSGLCSRQEMPATHINSQQQKTKDAERITEIRQKIEAHTHFSTISTELKRKIRGRKPPARLFSGWEELINHSHLKEHLFVPRWKHYSNYAHSEFISSLQLPLSHQDQTFMLTDICSTIEMGLMIVSACVIELLNLLPMLKDDYSSIWSEEQRIIINFYSTIALKPNIQINRQYTIPQFEQ